MLVGLAILFGSHYLLYVSVIFFFNITSQPAKHALLIVLAVLAVSFFLSSWLAHIQPGQLTRVFYIASGVWLGLLVNLLLATLAAWILIDILNMARLNFSSLLIGSFFFLLVAVYSIYGVWNAFNPKIVDIEAEIKNLPAGWQGKTAVQISDVHLGYIHQAAFLEKIVQMSNSVHPDIIFITGDFFDGQDGDLENLVGPLNNLKAPQGIYFVTGNHETYLGVDEVFSALKKTKVKILNDEVVQLNGLQIAGMSYPARGEKKDTAGFLASRVDFSKDMPTILLHHAPTDISEAEDLGIDLQLSGHTHKGQLFPFGFITHLVYKGYDYGLHKIGDFSIYTSVGAGTWGPPMRTGNRPEIAAIKLK